MMKNAVCIVSLVCTACVHAQHVSENEAWAYAHRWLQANPLAGRYQEAHQRPLELGEIALLEVDGSGPPFYVISLTRQGHIVLNSDRRLTPVVCFSFSGSARLDACEENALYQLLLFQGRANAARIASAGVETAGRSEWDARPGLGTLSAAGYGGAAGADVIGPLLSTTWGQGNHYNEYCPPAPDAPEGCDGRAPVGCVATAFAQILRYHEWPYRGTGWTTYEDVTGDITSAHTAVFSDPYEWWHMQNDYYAFGDEPNEAVQAVSELMYELGVAAGVDYEAAGSTSSSVVLGRILRRHFLYEPALRSASDDPTAFVDLLSSELSEGRPCVADIPGHSLVVDGVMSQQHQHYFHLNYGWSGQNDDWYLLDQVQEQAVAEVHTGIRPLLTAIPLGSEAGADGVELRWALPKTRSDEVTRLDVLERRTVSGTFTDHGEDFSAFEAISTRDANDWSVSDGGYAGTCFHKPSGGRGRIEYDLTSNGLFRPGAGTELQFKAKYILLDDSLAVRISTDHGNTYSTVWSVSDAIEERWTEISIPLEVFSGADIVVQVSHLPGGGRYYLGGGSWVDDIRLTSAEWYEWDVIHEVHTLEAHRAETTTAFHDGAEDFDGFRPGPAGPDRDWSLSVDGRVGSCFHKPASGQSGWYYRLTGTDVLRATTDTRLVFDARYMLFDDAFAVLISADNGQTWSTVWSATSAIREGWAEVEVPLDAFAGRDVSIRFEYVIEGGDYYYPQGGVWIDEIRLIEMTGLEYRDYPVYYTLLGDLVGSDSVLAYQAWSGEQSHPHSEAFTLTAPSVP